MCEDGRHLRSPTETPGDRHGREWHNVQFLAASLRHMRCLVLWNGCFRRREVS